MVLSYLSTVQDVIQCTDTELRDGIGKLNQEIVTDYILHLRTQLAAKSITINRLLDQPSGAPGQNEVANKVARLEVAHDNLHTDYNITKESLAKLTETQAQFKLSSETVLDSLATLTEEIERLKSSAAASSGTVSVIDAGFLGLTKMFLQGPFNRWFIGTDEIYGVHCNASNRLPTEEIRIVRLQVYGDSMHNVSLQSCHNRYLSAQKDGRLMWDRFNLGEWEKFEVSFTADPNIICLKSYHGKWVSARPDGKIVADRDEQEDSVYFIVHRR